MLYNVDQKHTSALARSKSDPNKVRFKENYNVGKVETDAAVGKLRDCKGRGKGSTARAPASLERSPLARIVSQPPSHAPRPRGRRRTQIQTSGAARRREARARRKAPIRRTPTMGGTPRIRMWMREEEKEKGGRRGGEEDE